MPTLPTFRATAGGCPYKFHRSCIELVSLISCTEEAMPKPPNFDKLRAALRQLNLEQAKQLYAELGEIVQDLQQVTIPEPVGAKRREVVEVKHIRDRLYQLERVRCGKVGCKCSGENGELHGPYWYAYWRQDGKLKSRYVGKQLRQIE